MSPIDYSLFSLPKGKPGVLVRAAKRVAAESRLDKVYAEVDARDGKVCQVRGTKLLAGCADEWRALERDHLATIGAHPERKYDVDNILTVSRGVHKLLQASALIPVDKHGEETTHVSQIAGYKWNRRHVAPGKEPFRLKELSDHKWCNDPSCALHGVGASNARENERLREYEAKRRKER